MLQELDDSNDDDVTSTNIYQVVNDSLLKLLEARCTRPFHSWYKASLYVIYACFLIPACTKNEKDHSVLFEALTSEQTQLHFTNKLTPTPAFNMFKYMYYYNGGGVGVGDFNNDGLIDIFFSANQGPNKLFLNQGGLKFKDVTGPSLIPQQGG